MTFIELYQIVLEMPVITGDYVSSILDDPKKNREQLKYILVKRRHYNKSKYKNYDLYYHKDNDIVRFYLIDVKDNKIILTTTIVENTTFDSFYSDHIWKDKNYDRNLMSNFFYDVLLTMFPSIQSTHMHTRQAKEFWKRLIIQGMQLGHKCSVVRLEEGTVEETIMDSAETLELYEPYIWNNQDDRIRIYAK